jgi:hypothetical protein
MAIKLSAVTTTPKSTEKKICLLELSAGDADDENQKEQMATLRKIEVFCMSIKIKGCEGIR